MDIFEEQRKLPDYVYMVTKSSRHYITLDRSISNVLSTRASTRFILMSPSFRESSCEIQVKDFNQPSILWIDRYAVAGSLLIDTGRTPSLWDLRCYLWKHRASLSFWYRKFKLNPWIVWKLYVVVDSNPEENMFIFNDSLGLQEGIIYDFYNTINYCPVKLRILEVHGALIRADKYLPTGSLFLPSWIDATKDSVLDFVRHGEKSIFQILKEYGSNIT